MKDRMLSYRITEAQLAEIGTMVRTGNAIAFSNLVKTIRKRRVVEQSTLPIEPKRIVYFSDFIMTELNSFLDRTDMNNLLLSASYLLERKRDFFYWRLTPEYSHKYYNSTADTRGSYNYEHAGERALFADVLNARLRDTRTQLSLTLAKGAKDSGDKNVRKRRDNTVNLAYLENLHALTLRNVDIVGSLAHLSSLREIVIILNKDYSEGSRYFSENLDMRHFSGCTLVHICGYYYTKFPHANIGCLQNCQRLWLENVGGVNAEKIASLPNLKKLFLHSCSVDYGYLNKSVSLYLSDTRVNQTSSPEGNCLGDFRELHIAMSPGCDIEGLAHLANAESLYMMPKRGARTLVKAFIKKFPNTKEWADDGTWGENMYY